MAMSAPAAAGGIVLPLPPPPSVSRARLSTSLEPTGLAGTSWNSIRWARPTGGTGYRTSRLANAFETSGTSTCSSSAASTCSAVPPRAQSPFAYAKLRSSDRAASTSRPHNDGTVIRANSRYGTSLLNSGSPTTSSARAASHSVSSGGAFKSSRQTTAAAAAAAEPLRRTIVAYRPLSYSGGGISQPRATLMDIRQNLRPVKRHTVTDHSTTPSSRTSSSASTLLSNVRAAFASTSAMAPAVLSNVSPTSTKDAQEGRSAHRLPTEPYDSTMRLLAAAKSTRRTSVEQQQLDAEQKLAQQIAALKCYVSEPGALDKSATVAKFRQRMAEGQAPASLRSISSPSGGDGTSAVAAATSNTSAAVPSSSGSTTASSSSAAALLARMPSLNRRATTAVTHDLLRSMEKQQQQAAVGRKKERPMSLVETALGNGGSRRLSVVKEGSVSGDTPRPGSTDEQTLSPPPETPRLPAAADGQSVNGNGKTPTALKSAKESPKLAKKRKTTTTTGGADSATQQQQQQQPTSASSSATTQNNSDGTVAKRKASPKTSGGVDGGTKEARPETTTTAPPKKQQLTLVKRLLTNNNGSSSNNNNNKTTLPTTPTQPSKPPKKAPQAKEEEEGNYNAVVQFRPQSMLQRKLCGVAKKSSASLSTLAETSDEPRPVPGTWQRSMKDRCISHNKHLIRRAASESTLHVHRAVPVLRVSSTRMLTPGRVANKCEGAFVNRLCQTHNAAISVRGAKGQSPTATVLKMIKSIARPRQQRVCAVAVLDKALSNKRRLRLGIQKTLVQKR
uniref:Uncharacterized protein n=1 Tax=Globodera pallida TaxID=36090 RepID=A0A183BKA9_GLOPA